MFKGKKLDIITNSIPDLNTLISNIKGSIVCSCFGQNISHSRGESCVVIVSFFYRSEKNIKISRKKMVLNLYIKTAM